MKLDLTSRKQKYFELTLLDGSMLQIKKPSEQMIIELDEFRFSMPKMKESKDAFEAIKAMTCKVLNCNIGMRSFNVDYLNENGYDYEICGAIIKAYEDFLGEVMKNPN